MGLKTLEEQQALIARIHSASNDGLATILGYKAPTFDDAQQTRVCRFFSNLESPVFSARLQGILSGALGSKYSRISEDLRTGLLRLADKNEGMGESLDRLEIPDLVSEFGYDFYQRNFGDYGDDSIAQVAPHMACFEEVTLFEAMNLLHHRPLAGIEKSTRYRAFDKKVEGQYPYFVDPAIEEAGLADDFRREMDGVFDEYAAFRNAKEGVGKEVMTHITTRTLPFDFFRDELVRIAREREWESPKEEELAEAYKRTTTPMLLDNVRHALPLSARTMLALQMNAQGVRDIILNGLSTPTTESVLIAEFLRRDALNALGPLVKDLDPSEKRAQDWIAFKHGTKMAGRDHQFMRYTETPRSTRTEMGYKVDQFSDYVRVSDPLFGFSVEIATKDTIDDLVAGIIKERNSDISMSGARRSASNMAMDLKRKLAKEYAGTDGRRNRRHKPGRAFEAVNFEFSLEMPIAEIRDLRRHRILTAFDPECYKPKLGYFVSPILKEAGFGDRLGSVYERLSRLYSKVANDINPWVATYGLPMATMGQMNVNANLREMHHICELRTQPGAHINYKKLCQMLYVGMKQLVPIVEDTMTEIDRKTELDIGRSLSELRTLRKVG